MNLTYFNKLTLLKWKEMNNSSRISCKQYFIEKMQWIELEVSNFSMINWFSNSNSVQKFNSYQVIFTTTNKKCLIWTSNWFKWCLEFYLLLQNKLHWVKIKELRLWAANKTIIKKLSWVVLFRAYFQL